MASSVRAAVALGIAAVFGACSGGQTTAVSTPAPTTPAIVTSPTALTFSAQIGSADPASQSISIANGGPGSLGTLGATSDAAWLTASLSGNTVTVSVSLAGQTPGDKTGHVSITASGASNSPVSVPVTFHVLEPTLSVPTTTMSFAAALGTNPASQTRTITNSGTGTLGTVTATPSYTTGSGWMSAGVTGTGNTRTLTVSVTTPGSEGTYDGTVTVASASTTNGSVQIPVHLVVSATAPPAIHASTTSLTFTTSVGTNPNPQAITVTNTGGGTLAAVTATPSYTTGSGWMSAAVTGSGNSQTVTVSITAPAAGSYAGSLELASVGASNTPVSIPVSLTVTSGTGTTWNVGPTRTYTTVAAVQSHLHAGDLVLIDGGTTYGAVTIGVGGTAGNPITYRGVGNGTGRPVFSGGANTIEVDADHVVIDNVIVTGGSERCLFYTSDDVTFSNGHIHDCPQHGILSSDIGSGTATVEFTEIDHCGSGTQKHPVYVTTDQRAHPGAVFTLRHSYIHASNGGHNLKSRAERTEVLYNWMEGAYYRDMECVCTDNEGTGAYKDRRCDCELIGNVFRKTTANVQAGLRFGTDGTSGSNGRVRIVNNTFLREAGTGPTIFLMGDATGGLDSIELHNNVFYASNGTPDILSDADLGAYWVAGRQVAGSNNWVMTGSTEVPGEWTGTVTGASPGFAGAPGNLTPTSTSPLRDAGGPATSFPAGHQFPNPVTTLPQFVPPAQTVESSATARPTNGTIDIGAYEYH